MPSHSTAQEPWHDLRDAYAAVGHRLEPGRGKPDQRQLQVVAEAPLPTTPVLWTDASATVVSAAIAARARVDVLSAGLGVVDQYFDDTRLRNVMRLSLGARSDLLAAAGEYCLALGAAPRASRFGTYASTFAQRPSQQYRAEAIIACSLALNGEYAAAKSHIEAAKSIAPEEERAADESHYLLLNAVGFVAIGEGNAPALEAIAGDLATLRPDDPFWSYTAGALEVVHSVLVGEFPRAIAHSMELLHSTRRNRSHRMVRQFLLCVRSGMHIAFGEPGAAHALVSGQETPPMHGVCFHAQRALALLALGRSTDVIDETDGCVAEQEHALRTLVQVLICRAIAFARCGAMTQSARSIEDAFGLMAHTRDWTSPFTMMPLRDSAELLDRVARRRPDLATVVATIRTVLGAICAPARADEADGTLLLTEAEIAIAQSLVTGDGVREIAAARSVSVSTVKSQLRSIYRKLGVSTREAAVLRMASSEAFAGLRGADRQRRDR